MKRKDKTFFALYGLGVWAVATAGLWLIGLQEDKMLINLLFLVVAMPLLNMGAYRYRRIRTADKAFASALFSVPGMVLDAVLLLLYPLIFAPPVFHTMPAQGHRFGGWLMFGYSITLLTAVASTTADGKEAKPAQPSEVQEITH